MKNMKKKLLNKIIGIAIVTLFYVYFIGHFSSVYCSGGLISLEEIMHHIVTQPFSLKFVQNVFCIGGLIYLILLLVMFSRTNLPKAEMKGEEHGSNDFQTPEETKEFLATNTTEILELDTGKVKQWEAGDE